MVLKTETMHDKKSNFRHHYWRIPGLKPMGQGLLPALLLLLLPFFTQAGPKPDSTHYCKYPVRISFGSQVVGFPYQNLFSAFHPVFSAGTEFRYNKNEKHRICQTLNIGYSFNEQIGNKLLLNSDFCYRYTHSSGVFADISMGLGLVDQYHPRKTYKYNSSTGEYDRVSDWGKFGIQLGYGMSLGYDLSRKTHYPVSLFVKNTFFIQSPYFDLKDFPVMPQSTVQIGVTIKIRKNEK